MALLHVPSFVRQMFSTTCKGIDAARRITLNTLFAALVVLLVVAVVRSSPPALRERTALVIAPEGPLVEQFSVDPLASAVASAMHRERTEVRLRDLLHALRAAKVDPRIERVVLQPGKLEFRGWASAREIAAAIDALRSSGKEVIAFAEFMDDKQYLLASHATRIYLDPKGTLLFHGIARQRLYFGGALRNRLGIDVHVLKAGAFKSGPEPYFRDDASPAAKEADAFWIGDIWNRYLGEVATARGIAPSRLAPFINQWLVRTREAGGDFAKAALASRLVDGLMTRGELDADLARRGIADETADRGFRQIGLDDYLARLEKEEATLRRPQVAVVFAEGEIKPGKQPSGSIGGETASAQLREARLDDKIKAVVLRVDSPGGESFASEQIQREVVALKRAGKAVAVSMGDYAASGGYMISADADRIFADASTITGSIGVYGVVPNFARMLGRLGIHSDGVGSSSLANAFDLTRSSPPELTQALQATVERNYRDFVSQVANGRHRPASYIETIASGRVWTGSQALERGLVDELGGLDRAIAFAAARSHLEPGHYAVRYVEEPRGFVDSLLTSKAGASAIAGLLRLSGRSNDLLVRQWLASAAPEVGTELEFLAASSAPGQSGLSVQMHCLCATR